MSANKPIPEEDEDIAAVQNYIIKKAKEYGVPPELALETARQENGWSKDVIFGKRKSSAGAIGAMQLMPGTAKQLGVDPNDVAQNIDGGVRLLADLLTKQKGDTERALRGYNAGEGAIDKSRRYKETNNYVDSISKGLQKRYPETAPQILGGTVLPQAQQASAPRQVAPQVFDEESAIAKAISSVRQNIVEGTKPLQRQAAPAPLAQQVAQVAPRTARPQAASQPVKSTVSNESLRLVEAFEQAKNVDGDLNEANRIAAELQNKYGYEVGLGATPYVKPRGYVPPKAKNALDVNELQIPGRLSDKGRANIASGKLQQEPTVAPRSGGLLGNLLEDIKRTVEPYVPGLTSINTQEGIKTTAAEQMVRSGITGGTAGIIDAGQVDPNRFHSEQERGVAQDAGTMSKLVAELLPFKAAGKVVEGVSQLPKVARGIERLRNAGRAGEAVVEGVQLGGAFGVVQTAKEAGIGINSNKDRPLSEIVKNIAQETGKGAVMGGVGHYVSSKVLDNIPRKETLQITKDPLDGGQVLEYVTKEVHPVASTIVNAGAYAGAGALGNELVGKEQSVEGSVFDALLGAGKGYNRPSGKPPIIDNEIRPAEPRPGAPRLGDGKPPVRGYLPEVSQTTKSGMPKLEDIIASVRPKLTAIERANDPTVPTSTFGGKVSTSTKPVAVAERVANKTEIKVAPEVKVDVVKNVTALTQKNKGATFNPAKGDLGGTDNYSVSIYPERSMVMSGNPAERNPKKFEAALNSFIDKNQDLLADSRHSVGTWFDKKGGKTYVDISVTLDSKDQAIELGKQYNQKAVFDLKNFKEIDTGGTGDAITNIPAESERLKAFDKASIDRIADQSAASPRNDLTVPTEAQKEAGNFKMGHAKIAGLDVSIEYPIGAKRKITHSPLKSHYGYIRKTEGADGEFVDVFIKEGTPTDFNGKVFVVDQTKEDGSFDEHKVLLGFDSEASARAGYAENYPKDFKVGKIATFENPKIFQDWLDNKAATKVPAAFVSASRTAVQTPGKQLDAALKKNNSVIKPSDQKGRAWLLSDGALVNVVGHPESAADALRNVGLQKELDEDFSANNSLGSRHIMARHNGAIRVLNQKGQRLSVELPNVITVEQQNTIAKLMEGSNRYADFDYTIYDPATGKNIKNGTSFNDLKREDVWERSEYAQHKGAKEEKAKIVKKPEDLRNKKLVEAAKKNPLILYYQPFDFEGSFTIENIVRGMNERTVEMYGDLPKKPTNEQKIERATEIAISEVVKQLAEENSGRDWYLTDIGHLEDGLIALFPELRNRTKMDFFKALLALTSNGQNPVTNTGTAVRLYEAFKAGGEKEIPLWQTDTNAETGKPKGWILRGAQLATSLETINRLIADNGVEGAVQFLNSKHTPQVLQKMKGKAKLGTYAGQRGYGSYIFGAKLGSFYQNIIGNPTELTMDLWWSRTWNRWMGTLVKPNGELADTAPRNDKERNAMVGSVEAMRTALREENLDLEVSEIQAVLWYYEQQLYKRHGAKVESYSYTDGILRVLNEKGKQNVAKKIQSERDGKDNTTSERGRTIARSRDSGEGSGQSTRGILQKDFSKVSSLASDRLTQLDAEGKPEEVDGLAFYANKQSPRVNMGVEPIADDASTQEIFDGVRWKVVPAKDSTSQKIYTNEQGMMLLDFITTKQEFNTFEDVSKMDFDYGVNGYAYPRASARRLQQNLTNRLEKLAKFGVLSPDGIAHAQEFLTAMWKPLLQNPRLTGVAIVKVGGKTEFGDLKETTRHERFHLNQYKYADDQHVTLTDLGFNEDGTFADWLTPTQTQDLRQAMQSLMDLGYKSSQASRELGAFLAGGQRQWEQLFGVTGEDARIRAKNLMELYIDKTIEVYDLTLENFEEQWNFVDKLMRDTYKERAVDPNAGVEYDYIEFTSLGETENKARGDKFNKKLAKQSAKARKLLQYMPKTEQQTKFTNWAKEFRNEKETASGASVQGTGTSATEQDIRQDLSRGVPQRSRIVKQTAEQLEGEKERDSLFKTAMTARKAGLLTAPRTMFKNVTSNTTSLVLEELSKVPASMIDLAVSRYTGERTVATPQMRDIAKAVDAVRTKGWKEFKLAMRGDNSDLSFEGWETALAVVNEAKGVKAERAKINAPQEINTGFSLLDGYINAVFNFQTAQDRVFRIYAVKRSIDNQARAIAMTEAKQGRITKAQIKERTAEITKGQNIDDELKAAMAVAAVEDAEFALFQNDNALIDALVEKPSRKLEEYFDSKVPGSGYAIVRAPLEQVMPFRKTPANVIGRVVAFTPIGSVIKSVYKAKELGAKRSKLQETRTKFEGLQKPTTVGAPIKGAMSETVFKSQLAQYKEYQKTAQEIADQLFESRVAQKEFAESAGRGGIGAALLILGFIAAAKGWLIPFTDDRNKRNTLEAANTPEGHLKVSDDKWIKISDTAPFGTLMVVGGSIYEQWNKKADSEAQRAANIARVGSRIILDHPLLTSTKTTLDAIGNPARATKVDFEKAGAAQVTSFIPSIVKQAARVVDPTERVATTAGEGIAKEIPFASKSLKPKLNALGEPISRSPLTPLDPFNTRTENKGAVISEVKRLGIGLTKATKAEGESKEQTYERGAKKGNAISRAMEEIMKTPQYQGMNDADKGGSLKALVAQAAKTKVPLSNSPLLAADGLRVAYNAKVAAKRKEMIDSLEKNEDFNALSAKGKEETKKEVTKLFNEYRVDFDAEFTPKSMTKEIENAQRDFEKDSQRGLFQKELKAILRDYKREK